MKIYILIIVLFINFSFIFAQNKSIPGYRNQRNTISLGIRPYITLNDNRIMNNLLMPSFELTYDRVLSRRSTISVTYGIQNYTIDGNSSSLSNFYSNGNRLKVIYNNNPEPAEKLKSQKGYIRFSNTNFNISKTFFITSRGAIAPYGQYVKLGLSSFFYKIKEDKVEYEVYQRNVKFSNNETQFNTQQLYAMNFELGSKTFFGKHFFINRSASFSLPLNFWAKDSYKEFDNISNYHESFLNNYMSYMQMLNVKLAVGMAF